MKRGENNAVNPIDTRFHNIGEIVNFHQNTNSENGEDNDLSLLSPKYEENFTNPSVVVVSENRETSIADLVKGAGEDTSDGLPTIANCKKRLGTLESKKRSGAVSEATYQKGIAFWTNELQNAQAREGLKK